MSKKELRKVIADLVWAIQHYEGLHGHAVAYLTPAHKASAKKFARRA